MKLTAALTTFFCLACFSVNAEERVQPAGGLVPVTIDNAWADDTADTEKTDDASAGNSKEDRREATRWLNAELKDRTHILTLLKKVKDKKSADKVGATLVKEYVEKAVKKTAMGDAEPPKRPTGPAMEECEKKYKAKFRKLDDGIADQLKRIEELELDSDDLKEGLKVMPKYSSSSSAD